MINKINFSLNIFGVTTTENISSDMQMFYNKALVELATPNLVHEQFAQKRKLPKNSGSSIEFRSYSSLPKVSQPLTEGVTPTGSSLNIKSITCTPEAYGDYVQFSDVLDTDSVDNTVLEATRKLADQAGRTLDTIVRNELNGGTNVMYSPYVFGVTEIEIDSRSRLMKRCNLAVREIFKATTELKAMNAPKINGYYVGIIHPYAAYDLIQNAGDRWVNVSEYASPEERFVGEIGMVAGVRFVESTEARVFGPKFLLGGHNFLTILDGNMNSSTATLTQVVPDQDLSGVTLYVNGELCEVNKIQKVDGVSTLFFKNPLASDVSGGIVAAPGGTPEGLSVFSTIIMGADAYGVTDTEDGIENIVKQKGSGNDPLNQRCTVGWKARKCAKRLVEEYMIRIESISTFSADIMDN